jgi:hypothetical protein
VKRGDAAGIILIADLGETRRLDARREIILVRKTPMLSIRY